MGEVRRIYVNDFRTELYITDYTTNAQLYDYSFSNQEGQTGDPYGYIEEPSAKWPGPWGKMTITITCRDGQARLANAKVKAGDFVSLRNVHIRWDPNHSKAGGQLSR